MKQGQAARLQRLEQEAQPKVHGFELWVGTGEDDMLSPNGEIISVEEFARRYPDAVSIDTPAIPQEM